MKQKTLLLMSGPSGAGKSYWVKNFIKDRPNAIWVSRDAVRFSMVSENEKYFSKENDVFKEWIRQIQEALDSEGEGWVIADATHLNERSRNKTLDALILDDDIQIIPVFSYPGVQKCLENNEKRYGRAYVPRSVIRRMAMNYEPPVDGEKYKYYSILEIVEKGDFIKDEKKECQ